MKKLLLILIFFSSILYAGVGKVVSVKGDVSIERGTQSLKAEIGTILELKDRIVTKNLSKAFIMMNDKTSITIGKNSNMAISEFVYDEKVASNNKANFNFGKGVFRTLTGGIGKLNKNKFKIKTKSASIGIRGTVFDVAVTDDKTKVGVIEGGVYYVDAQTAQSFEVRENEKLVYDDTTGKVDIAPGQIEETDEINQDDQELKKEQERLAAKKKADEEKAKKEKEEQDRLAKEKKDKEEKERLEREKKEREEAAKKKREEELEKQKREEEEARKKREEELEKKKREEELAKQQKEEELAKQQKEESAQNNPSTQTSDEEGSAVLAGDPNSDDGTGGGTPPIGGTDGQNPPPPPPTDGGFGLGEGDSFAFGSDEGLDGGAFNSENQPELQFNPNENVRNENLGNTDLGTTLDNVDNAAEVADETSTTANELGEETNANAPEFTIGDSFSLDEDDSFNLTLNATDDDGDNLEYAIATQAEHGTAEFNAETGVVTYTPNENFTGTDTVEVQVYDGKNIVKKTITFTVANLNDAPQLVVPTDTTLSEDSSVDLQLEGSDVDGDTLTYSVVGDVQNGQVSISEEGIITYTPNANFNGSEEVTVAVSDGEESVEQVITFTVEGINDAPDLTIPDDTTLSEDGSIDLELAGTDVDNDSLTYSLTSDAQNGQVTINEETGVVTFVPNANFFGTEEVTVEVTDGEETTSKTFNFTVESVNDAPTITEVSTQTIDENTNSIFNLNGVDLEGDSITYEVTNTIDNGIVSIDSTTGDITFTPNDHFFGTQSIDISISDGIDTITTTVEVVVNEVVFQDELIAELPSESLDQSIEAITLKIMNNSYSSSDMEFGYIAEEVGAVVTPTGEFYVTGDITPTEVIQQFITDQNTMMFMGGVSALVDGVQSEGSINLNVDFGTQSFTGTIGVTEGNWDATINSGSVTTSGITSNDITGSSDLGSITSGEMDGKFYGAYAGKVGGKFELNTASSTAKGAYGAESP